MQAKLSHYQRNGTILKDFLETKPQEERKMLMQETRIAINTISV